MKKTAETTKIKLKRTHQPSGKQPEKVNVKALAFALLTIALAVLGMWAFFTR